MTNFFAFFGDWNWVATCHMTSGCVVLVRAKSRGFRAKYQSFPQDVKVDLIICGKGTVFCGIKADISTEISIDSAEMSKEN